METTEGSAGHWMGNAKICLNHQVLLAVMDCVVSESQGITVFLQRTVILYAWNNLEKRTTTIQVYVGIIPVLFI